MTRRKLPARFPPHGAWPAEMRADTVAAFFDCHDTGELFTAILRHEVLRPTSSRGRGRSREPVWARAACELFISQKNRIDEIIESESLADDI